MNNIGPLIINIDGVMLSKDEAKLLEHDLIGSVILFSHNYKNKEQLRKLIKDIKNIKENILISVDHEGGKIQRFKSGFTILPSFEEIGSFYNRYPLDTEQFLKRGGPWMNEATRLSYACGFVSGYELKHVGIDMNFSPVVDMYKNFSTKKQCILNGRSFSDRPEIVSELADKYIRGSLHTKIIPVIKHYPGHGVIEGDTHIDFCSSDWTIDALLSLHLQPFINVNSAYDGNLFYMTSHIKFPKVDNQIITYSKKWLREISMKIFAYRGYGVNDILDLEYNKLTLSPSLKKPFFISDDIEMKAALNDKTASQRVIDALEAGCNMIIATTMLKKNIITSNKSHEYFIKNYLTEELIDYYKDFCNDKANAISDYINPSFYTRDIKSTEEDDEKFYKQRKDIINDFKEEGGYDLEKISWRDNEPLDND